MKLLITGATGFIGISLIKYLKKHGHSITIAHRNSDQSITAEEYDCLIHLAGRAHVLRETATDAYQAFKEANVDYALQMARRAQQFQIKKFIFVSSIGVNGNDSEDHPFTENDTPAPHNTYAQTKWEAELALKMLFQGSNTALTIIRPPLVYGPNPKANFRALLNLCHYPLPLPFGAIHNRRSFVGIDNLCHFIELCCTHPSASNQTFLISDDHDVSVAELVSAMRKALHRAPCLLPVPIFLLKVIFKLIGRHNFNEQLLANLQIDTSKAKHLLNWRPLITFDEGIQRAVTNDAK